VLRLWCYSWISGIIQHYSTIIYIDTGSAIMNYHSNFHIGPTFWICSPISLISITQPLYQQIHNNSQAKCEQDVYHLWISNGCNFSILNGHSLSAGYLIPSQWPNVLSLMVQCLIPDETMCHQYLTSMACQHDQSHIRDKLETNNRYIGAMSTEWTYMHQPLFWPRFLGLGE